MGSRVRWVLVRGFYAFGGSLRGALRLHASRLRRAHLRRRTFGMAQLQAVHLRITAPANAAPSNQHLLTPQRRPRRQRRPHLGMPNIRNDTAAKHAAAKDAPSNDAPSNAV